jgi:hypothetical protein
MNSFLIGLLGLLAVTLAIIRSADHLHALWRGRRAGRPNLRRPAVLAAATSVSSTLYAHCVGHDFFLLTAALINAANALMGVLLPTASAAVAPPPVEQPGNVEEGP